MSEYPEITEVRYTEPELNKYYANRDEIYRPSRIGANILATIGLVVVFIGFVSLFSLVSEPKRAEREVPGEKSGLSGLSDVSGFIICWFIGGGMCVVAFAIRDWINKDINRIVAENVFKEQSSQSEQIAMTKSATDMIAKDIEYLKKISEHGNRIIAVGPGGVFVGGNNTSSPITTNTFYSSVGESYNKNKNDAPAIADAVKNIAAVIDMRKDDHGDEAKEYYELLLKEMDGGKNKRALSAFWDKIVKLVPDVATLAESCAKLTSTFS